MPRLAGPDPQLPHVFDMQMALAAGLSRGQVQHRLASGRWLAIGRGVYVPAESLMQVRGRPERDRRAHVLLTDFMSNRHPDAAVGLESAALQHQLPIWAPVPKTVIMLVPPEARARRRDNVVLRTAALDPAHVLQGRVPVTTVARTCLDIARVGSLADALVVGDGALRSGKTDPDAIAETLRSCSDMRGLARARDALAHLSALRESPAESASWAYFIEHDIPLPRMQVKFSDARGVVYARVDFWWEHAHLVGECDGRLKYLTGSDLWEEKRRQEKLENAGERVTHWGVTDLRTPELAERLHGLLDAAPRWAA